MYVNRMEGYPKVFVSGGMHKYENTKRSAMSLITGKMSLCELNLFNDLYNNLDLYIVPDINPINYAGLNRSFLPEKEFREYKFIEDTGPFSLALDLHADVEDETFYMYERRHSNRSIMRHVMRRIKKFSDIGEKQNNHKNEGTLEEHHWRKGTTWSITTEAPGKCEKSFSDMVNTMTVLYAMETFLWINKAPDSQ